MNKLWMVCYTSAEKSTRTMGTCSTGTKDKTSLSWWLLFTRPPVNTGIKSGKDPREYKNYNQWCRLVNQKKKIFPAEWMCAVTNPTKRMQNIEQSPPTIWLLLDTVKHEPESLRPNRHPIKPNWRHNRSLCIHNHHYNEHVLQGRVCTQSMHHAKPSRIPRPMMNRDICFW